MKKAIWLLEMMMITTCWVAKPERTHAQDWPKVIDSLITVIQQEKNDSIRARALGRISFAYSKVDPQKGIHYSKMLGALAREMTWDSAIAVSYYYLASNYLALNEVIAAQNNYWESFRINDKINNRKGLARNYHSFAVIYTHWNDDSMALINFRHALEIYQSLGDIEGVLGCYSNIAQLYQSMNLYDSAIENHRKSLVLRQQIHNTDYVAYTESQIGTNLAHQGKFNEALILQHTALDSFEKGRDRMGVALVLTNIAETQRLRYLSEKIPDSSIIYYKKALDIYSEVNINDALGAKGKVYAEIARIYLSDGTASHAPNPILLGRTSRYLDSAIGAAMQVHDRQSLSDFYYTLYLLDSIRHNPESSLKYYKLHINYLDSVKADRDENIIRNQQAIYQHEKYIDSSITARNKLIQSEELEKQRIIFYSAGGFTLFLSVLFFVIYKRRVEQLKHKNQLEKKQADIKVREAELKEQIQQLSLSAIRSQMNPHFIFNALNTIQSFIYSDNKSEANNYLANFADLIRKILSYSTRPMISLSEEIDMLILYIELEQKRFRDKFTFKIETDEALSHRVVELPPMLLQPYVENAIKHGLFHKQGERHLLVKFEISVDNEHLLIIIKDNGIGRNLSGQLNKQKGSHSSFANEANEKRISLIEEIYKKPASIMIEDNKNEMGQPAGTTVQIQIPLTL